MSSNPHLFHSLQEASGRFGPCALTVGNFDGVHAGHRRIMRRVAEVARERGWKAAVLTFDPHPATLVAPDRAPELMTTPEQRARLMSEEGISQVLILPFTPQLAHLSAEEFARDVLRGALEARAVLVGHNFRFGHEHAGDTRLLEQMGARFGFSTEVVPAVTVRGRVASSSEIRRLIRQGRVSLAGRLLERPFALEGEVVHGYGIGSKQTVPTLNLKPEAGLLPARGVYVTQTTAPDGRLWPSITNVGHRPTFGGDVLTVETHLLAALVGASPPRIHVEFLKRLREERKFSAPDELKLQILRDVARAKAYFRRLGAHPGTGTGARG